MTKPSPEVSNRKPFDIDTATKLIASFTILFYIFGFITTNLYLQQFGFSDFSLLKPRFILTGSLVVASIVLNLLIVSVGYSLISRKSIKAVFKGNKIFSEISEMSKALLLLVVPLIACFIFVSKSNTGSLSVLDLLLSSVWLYSINLILGLISIIPFLSTIFPPRKIFLPKRNPTNFNLRDNYTDFGFLLIFYIICGYVYLGLFTQEIYPKIPEQFGGGEPRQVRILFVKDQADIIKQNGIPTCSSDKLKSNWSKPVSLLFEGSEHYLLRLDKTRYFQLKKTTVIGLELISVKYNQKQKLADCPSYLTK